MTDVILSCTPSDSSSAVKMTVSWVKNGAAAVNVDHANFNPVLPFSCSYLTDTNGTTADGDVISATIVAVDGSGLASSVTTPSPASVTIPATPPDPPTNATLTLK
jgi:hypothetical protein